MTLKKTLKVRRITPSRDKADKVVSLAVKLGNDKQDDPPCTLDLVLADEKDWGAFAEGDKVEVSIEKVTKKKTK